MDTKQVIILRKDLNMRKGKMIAQGAHASLKVFFDKFKTMDVDHLFFTPTKEELAWIEGRFTKIVVGCDSEEELLSLFADAKYAELNVSIIKDAGLTEFDEPTFTAVAIGPNKSSKIDKITENLKLL